MAPRHHCHLCQGSSSSNICNSSMMAFQHPPTSTNRFYKVRKNIIPPKNPGYAIDFTTSVALARKGCLIFCIAMFLCQPSVTCHLYQNSDSSSNI
eukprot:8524534-Ditylum_brightwellii.AAC.1